MATLTLRIPKGSSLSAQEMDDNLSNLNSELPSTLTYDSATNEIVLTDIGANEKRADVTPIIDEATALAIALG